jgi:M6 family metalloprotease-like protein
VVLKKVGKMGMKLGIGILRLLSILLLFGMIARSEEGKVLYPLSIEKRPVDTRDHRVVQSGFYSQSAAQNILSLEREKPWSLPKLSAAAAPQVDTIRVLAMRLDFQYENPDDPLTTGRGKFDMRDTLTFFNQEGHMIDPSPHVARYFEKHLEALNNYWADVSDRKLVIIGDVYPQVSDSAYHLPHTMGYYGAKDPYIGLVEFFDDAIKLVDTAEPGLRFADYDSYFCFHAGSDRQNDIGFPLTESDLYTGNVFLGEPLYVDKSGTDSTKISSVVIFPEAASQDGRATAMNAVLAHEFGHQLGLVDLYNTSNFFTQVGDFSLMDNNGFGTGLDFGFRVGRVFGCLPVYPDAWSRCFLGFEQPVLFRQGTNIPVVAAEMLKDGIKVAKVPISEFEYYLIENRRVDIDNAQDALLADSATSVIIGPIDLNRQFTGEYDILLPGSGILIWHVDERVAAMLNNQGISNFEANRLQVDPTHRFIELMEADGLVNFGGNYYAGFGAQQDMYYLGNNTSFTPNTNPPSIGYYGVNSHTYITNISSQDTTMTFDLENGFLSQGCPRRAGYPVFGLSPVAADVDNDGRPEIIVASNRNILVLEDNGEDSLTPGPPFYDTTFSYSGQGVYEVPLFARTRQYSITAGPVVGDFGNGPDQQYVAVGASNEIHIYKTVDQDGNGQADLMYPTIAMQHPVVALMTSGNKLLAIENDRSVPLGYVRGAIIDKGQPFPASPYPIHEKELFGITHTGKDVVIIAGDSAGVRLYTISDTIGYDLGGHFTLGPVCVDLDRDSLPEIIVASPEGVIKAIKIDTTQVRPVFSIYGQIGLHDSLYVNPVLADIDGDGYADIIAGGKNKIFALDRHFLSLADFPLMIDRAYPNDFVIAAPVVADINGDHHQDIVIVTSNGNCYAFGPELLYGFPIAAGGVGVGSPLIFKKSNGGGLGFLGVDGWFYSYDVGFDSTQADWPMGGGDPYGSFHLKESRLGQPAISDMLPRDKFFSYPNPTLDGRTTIRYFLGADADITLTMYSLSGKRVDEIKINGRQGTGERPWDGSALPTGVYRCLIQADFGNETQTAFTDIAIIK